MNFLVAIVVIVVGATFIVAGVTGDWRTLFKAVSGISPAAAQVLGSVDPLVGAIGNASSSGSAGVTPASSSNLAGVIPAGYPHSTTGLVSV